MDAVGDIDLEHLAINKRALCKATIYHPGRFSLDLSVYEIQTDGSLMLLGADRYGFGDMTLVSHTGPDSTSIYSVPWDPPMPIVDGRDAVGCAQVIRHRDDGSERMVGDEVCEVITPEIP